MSNDKAERFFPVVFPVVMAGLVPAIHVFLSKQDVDARHKAGHDGWEIR